MATDEADAALHHQRNGFSRVLNEAERNYFLLRRNRKVQHPKKHTDTPTRLNKPTLLHVSISVCTTWVRETGVARKPQF